MNDDIISNLKRLQYALESQKVFLRLDGYEPAKQLGNVARQTLRIERKENETRVGMSNGTLLKPTALLLPSILGVSDPSWFSLTLHRRNAESERHCVNETWGRNTEWCTFRHSTQLYPNRKSSTLMITVSCHEAGNGLRCVTDTAHAHMTTTHQWCRLWDSAKVFFSLWLHVVHGYWPDGRFMLVCYMGAWPQFFANNSGTVSPMESRQLLISRV
jgi:hypothetical protein